MLRAESDGGDKASERTGGASRGSRSEGAKTTSEHRPAIRSSVIWLSAIRHVIADELVSAQDNDFRQYGGEQHNLHVLP
eukprot:15434331-Alexandrium_andersonii.AAC.1